jgi:hypothetical protein
MISCHKEKNKIKPDDILFSNLSSPILASTVRDWSFENHGVCSVDIPIPADSSNTILLDINNDSDYDFKITLSHNYWEPTQYCGHCSVYNYDIKINGINSSNSIAFNNQSFKTKYFNNSDKISSENSWKNQAILTMKGGCMRPTFDIEGEYIGFKHNDQIGWIKIQQLANNGILVENYAINLTDKKSIIAGQKD